MRTLALLSLYAMSIGLVILGTAGVLFPLWDFHHQLGITSLAGLDDQQRATLLVQYRYLKTYAVSLGLFGLLFRREIFTAPAVNRLYLTFLTLAVVGRILGLLFDGRPDAVLAYAIIPFEGLVPLVIWLYTRHTLVRADDRMPAANQPHPA